MTCNRCGEPLEMEGERVMGHEDIYLSSSIKRYCINPACPSYALVQIPAECMLKEGKG